MHALATTLIRTLGVAVLLALAPVVALAQGSAPGCELGEYDPSERPDPEGTPTEVGVGVYVIHLDRVDNLDQSFRLDAFLRLSWRDPRLATVVHRAGAAQCRFAVEAVWDPQVISFNRQDASLLLPEVVTVDAEGKVLYLRRFQTTLRSPMDLRDFPLDRQVLPLTLISVAYDPESVTLSHDETSASREKDLPVPGWQIRELVRRSGALDTGGRGESFGGRRLFCRPVSEVSEVST